MKKLLCFVLAAACLLSSTVALAETKTIDPTENRKIKLQKVGLNEVEEGISPTTGLKLSMYDKPEGFAGMAVTNRYMPMTMQIGNDQGRMQWGTSYADVLYESHLYSTGQTRLTAIFNDLLPDSVGFCRSARVGHAWLWYEWRGGFLFYGQQEYDGTNVLDEFEAMKVGYLKSGLTFSGVTGGKKWNQFYSKREPLMSPFNRNANVAGMYTIIDPNYVPPNHAFKFTDEAPSEGDLALRIRVCWGTVSKNEKTRREDDARAGSMMVYDFDTNTYLRYHRDADNVLTPHIDGDNGQQLAFSNVIVQYTDVTFKKKDAPIVSVIGKDKKGNFVSAEGNADIFMCGKHIEGYWKRDSLDSRTVFYGPDGQEISLQRGKTMIFLMPNDGLNGSNVAYSNTYGASDN